MVHLGCIQSVYSVIERVFEREVQRIHVWDQGLRELGCACYLLPNTTSVTPLHWYQTPLFGQLSPFFCVPKWNIFPSVWV